MPDLDFKVTTVCAASKGMAPLLQFRVAVTNATDEVIRAVVLQTQIQIQCSRRPYTSREKHNLLELFGTPERWGETLRNRLWISTNTTVGIFEREIEAVLSVPCTYDLTLAATKYFYGLEGGEIPLLFLFSGTIFYSSKDGPVQTQPISWNKEAVFRMPVLAWKDLMEEHFPNSAWICMRRDVFDRLYAFKRANGDATWENTIERLLSRTIEEGQDPPSLPSAELRRAGEDELDKKTEEACA